MPDLVTEIMLADAKKYLLPALKKITPFDTGVLFRSLDVAENKGRARAYSRKQRDHLVSRIDLTVNGYLYRILVGAVKTSGHKPHPSIYGRDLYNKSRRFRSQWDGELKRYERQFSERVLKAIGQKIGLLGRS